MKGNLWEKKIFFVVENTKYFCNLPLTWQIDNVLESKLQYLILLELIISMFYLANFKKKLGNYDSIRDEY